MAQFTKHCLTIRGNLVCAKSDLKKGKLEEALESIEIAKWLLVDVKMSIKQIIAGQAERRGE